MRTRRNLLDNEVLALVRFEFIHDLGAPSTFDDKGPITVGRKAKAPIRELRVGIVLL